MNYVGVDLNTASAPLLSYVSGIGPSVANNIVSHEKIGGLKRRGPPWSQSLFSKSL